jgi:ubiquinone/menaquinone biosynthesis C-methylase UbiE
VSWQLFERAASNYEAWYTTARGRLADAAEQRLMLALLARLRPVRSALEVGSGTGHFTAFLARQGLAAIGLDRSPAMLAQARRLFPQLSLVLGDAQQLPFRDGCIDLAIFVTTLEFVDDPMAALREAVRVARRGVIVIALNRCSLGGLSRRFGPQSRGALLGRAHDYSRRALLDELRRAATTRFAGAWSATTLLPGSPDRIFPHFAFGDVIGAAVSLAPSAEPMPDGPAERNDT